MLYDDKSLGFVCEICAIPEGLGRTHALSAKWHKRLKF